MKAFKRFKQSYKTIINEQIAWYKESTSWSNKRIAYGLGLGEMFEWANDCKMSAAILYKADKS